MSLPTFLGSGAITVLNVSVGPSLLRLRNAVSRQIIGCLLTSFDSKPYNMILYLAGIRKKYYGTVWTTILTILRTVPIKKAVLSYTSLSSYPSS